ncbi:MAG: hypothetical protein GYB26_15000 [Gammaproteobacteria bacterium]|nr:hypothetical protein [Gammaproteobacteria bacterium]
MTSSRIVSVLLALTLFALTGCGTTHSHTRNGVSQVEDWQPEYEAKQTSVKDVTFKSSTLFVGDGWYVMELEQTYLVQKVLYDQPVYYSRYSKEPNLLYILNPFLWLICLDKPSECFGREGEWSGPYDNGDKTVARVIDQESRSGYLAHPSAELKVSVVASNQAREWRETFQPRISGGKASINLKEALESAPFKPTSVVVHGELRAGDVSTSHTSLYKQATLDRLNLFSESWLSKPELYTHYVHQIRLCMNESDYKCAVQQFFKIQALRIQLPDTFYFHFAKALSRVGDTDNARKAAQMYLKDSRHMAYAAEAEAYL